MENKGFEADSMEMENKKVDPDQPEKDGPPTDSGINGTQTDIGINGPNGDAEQGVLPATKEDAPSVKSLCTKPYAGMGKEELLQFSQTPAWRAARWLCLLIILAGWCTMLGFAIYLIVSTPRCLPWWQSAVVYQIFPRSFRDSPVEEGSTIGGDGIGDFKGIIDSVDYLQSLGINAVLLHSIYKSGGQDNGEDVVDFFDVDEDLGDINDFNALVQALHDVDIKVILDFIPNHSSREHEFFDKIKKGFDNEEGGDPSFQNYYTLVNRDLVNNWASLYSGEAWDCSYFGNNRPCYLHQYSEYQPDLNLENEKVEEHLTEALEEWFTRGVDGFSIRGVSYFYEPSIDAQRLYNEPANPDYSPIDSDKLQYDETLHYYTAEYGDKVHDLLNKWRDGVFYKFSTAGTYRVMLTDSNSNSTYAQTYYGTSKNPGSDLPMNFNLLDIGDPDGNGGTVTGRQIETHIKDWMDKLEDGNWPNFQLGNYGAHRVASRLSSLYTKVSNLLLLTLPGTPLCYYGDEIGMQDIELTSLDQVKDLRGINDPDVWELKTRDYERSPMQWSSTDNAGFSEADPADLYLPVHGDYERTNVEVQDGDKNSALELFRRMISVRSEYRALTSSDITFVASSNEVIAYVREIESENSRFLVALNFGDENSEDDYYNTGDGATVTVPLQGTVVVATNPGREDSRVELNKLHLAPGEGVVVLLDEVVYVNSGWWYKFFTPRNN